MFFLLLAEIIPPTSLVVPLLGKFVLFTMILDTFRWVFFFFGAIQISIEIGAALSTFGFIVVGFFFFFSERLEARAAARVVGVLWLVVRVSFVWKTTSFLRANGRLMTARRSTPPSAVARRSIRPVLTHLTNEPAKKEHEIQYNSMQRETTTGRRHIGSRNLMGRIQPYLT